MGYVVKIQAPFSISNLPAFTEGYNINSEALRAEVAKLVSSGILSVESPFVGMHDTWSDIDKQNLKISLSEMFKWKPAI